VIFLSIPPAKNSNTKKTTSSSSSQNSSTQTTQTRYMLVNSDSLNVRSGPSSDYGVVGRLSKNTRVQILNSSGQWWKIKSGNIEGYVNSSYLSNESVPVKSSVASDESGIRSAIKQVSNERVRLPETFTTTRDQKFQDDYEAAVKGYDRKMQALPPNLPLPGGVTVQEAMDSSYKQGK
jgi:uncharacterized protein YgiM (DUF1202 family)